MYTGFWGGFFVFLKLRIFHVEVKLTSTSSAHLNFIVPFVAESYILKSNMSQKRSFKQFYVKALFKKEYISCIHVHSLQNNF